MAEGRNDPDIQPGKMKVMTFQQCLDRAERIFNLRGRPPYTLDHYKGSDLSPDELGILSDYMTYWNPFLVEKVK